MTLTASDDGTVLLGDNDDSAKRFGGVTHFPAAVWPEGSTRAIYDFETGVYVGEIPQPEKTFNVMGGKNILHYISIYNIVYCQTPYTNNLQERTNSEW